MIRTLLAIAATATVMVSLPAQGDTIDPAPLPARWSWAQSHACEYEDSVNCYWDARTAGNGAGHSFTAVEMPGSAHQVCVFYWGKKYGQRNNYCS